jgi:hypothetical protein
MTQTQTTAGFGGGSLDEAVPASPPLFGDDMAVGSVVERSSVLGLAGKDQNAERES